MRIIENMTFDQERALYGSENTLVKNCKFDGPADGESAFKECRNVAAEDCFFNLRYPFWHDDGLKMTNCETTELCRAALWYSDHVQILDSRLHGIKAMRECGDVTMRRCDVISAEFGWSTRGMVMEDCSVEGEYFMLRSDRLDFKNVRLKGKYSFQYITDSVFEDCYFDTKDAFWHAKNVTVRNSVVKGEYLAWYCENVTFENCRLIGTQPLCYCKNLKLINCAMEDTDLCFERSEVEATITTPVLSIKNPKSGYVCVPSAGEIIFDEDRCRGVVAIAGQDDENARAILEQGYTCVLCRGAGVHTTTLRGVRPLVRWLESGLELKGFSAADKVVGRATAFLYCLLGVQSVYAQVMSRAALEVLHSAGIRAEYGKLTDHIINRRGDGICPFEAAVMEITAPAEALRAIREKMAEMNIPV